MQLNNISKLTTAGAVSITALFAMLCLGFLNNTYVDLHSFKTSNYICKIALIDFRKSPYTLKDKYEKGDVFERISALGMGVELLIVQIFLMVYTVIAFCIAIKIAGVSSKEFVFILLTGSLLDILKTRIEIYYKLKLEEKIKVADGKIYQQSNTFINNFDVYLLNGIEELGQEQLIFAEKEKYSYYMKQEVLTAVSQAITLIITTAQTAVLSFVLFKNYIIKLVTFGNVVLLYSLLDKMNNVLKSFFKAIKNVALTYIPIQRYVEITKFKRKQIDIKAEVTPNSVIAVQNVCVIKNERKILDEVNFNLLKGDKVALVGHNGSGKSTLLRVILGLEDLDSGNSFINNKNSSKIGFTDRENVAYIPALPLLYSQPIEENIKMSSKSDYIATDI